jgi:hydroxymethylbilane synthase
MWQTEWVSRLLEERHPNLRAEIVTIRTLGDRNRGEALSGLARQGVFTREIEEALLEGRADAAVHSLKDLPVRLPEGLRIGAVLERADPRDALLARSGETLSELPAKSVVGTSSLRRRSQILHLRPDLVVRDLRGNVPTRLGAVGIRAEEGAAAPVATCDAIVLARAGLVRLGFDRFKHEILAPEMFLPAPGQGAVAVEIRTDGKEIEEVLRAVHDPATAAVVAAEREFLDALGGWCHVPVGAYAEADASGLRLLGLVATPDGKRVLRGASAGRDPREVGLRLAAELSRQGAMEIIERVVSETTGEEEPS